MVQRDLPALRVAVVGAQGPEAERRFTPGVVVGPLSVGRQGDWALEGRGVGAIDGFLYYDGRELFACSREGGSPMLLDGRPLGTTWEPLPLGALLVVGRLRLVVEDPTPAPDSSSTILTDLDAMKAPPAPAPRPAAPVFARDDENTRVGEPLPSASDLDDQPTAFLSSSVRDAVREGLAREAVAVPVARPAALVTAAPAVVSPSHVLRVDRRPSSAPPPVQAQGSPSHESPFFATPPSVAGLPAEPMSLPRLSEAVPLYGVAKASRAAATDPPAPSTIPNGSALAMLWRHASPVRKATLVLLPVALAGFAFVVLAPEPAAPRPRAEVAKVPTSPATPAAASASPTAAEAELATPRLVGGSNGLAKAPDGGVTLERRAVDAVVAHRLDEASVLYKDLVAADPKNAAVGAAARVVATGAPSSR